MHYFLSVILNCFTVPSVLTSDCYSIIVTIVKYTWIYKIFIAYMATTYHVTIAYDQLI